MGNPADLELNWTAGHLDTLRTTLDTHISSEHKIVPKASQHVSTINAHRDS